jgi:hypothetical protein
MLKKLLRDLAKRIREAVPFDPKQYDDPIAAQTKWTPARRGGSSFCTRKLIQKSFHRYKFRPAIGAIIFYLIFLIIGLGLLAASLKAPFLPESIKMNDGSPITLIIGGVFALIGAGMFYFGTKPIIFDKQQGYFYKGRHAPSVTSYNVRGKNHISLNQIHAIQLISEFCRGNKSSYYSYELNLVLQDASRMNVVDHGKLSRIQKDAQKLAEFLGVPLWDAT